MSNVLPGHANNKSFQSHQWRAVFDHSLTTTSPFSVDFRNTQDPKWVQKKSFEEVAPEGEKEFFLGFLCCRFCLFFFALFFVVAFLVLSLGQVLPCRCSLTFLL